MPSDLHNSTYRLDFFTVQHYCSPRGAFWHTAVCTMHSSWTYQYPPLCAIHLCCETCQFGGGMWWLPFTTEIVCIISSDYFDHTKQLLICITLWQVEHGWKWSIAHKYIKTYKFSTKIGIIVDWEKYWNKLE